MKPYINIWLSPIQTFEHLKSTKEGQSIYFVPILILGIIGGINGQQNMAATTGLESTIVNLIISVLLSTFGVYLFLHIFIPWLIKIIGKIWKGEASMTQLGNVCALSMLPFSILLLFQLAQLLNDINPNVELLNSGIRYMIWLWSFSLLIVGVAKVQGFTYGFALLNIVLGQLPIHIIYYLMHK